MLDMLTWSRIIKHIIKKILVSFFEALCGVIDLRIYLNFNIKDKEKNS